MIILEPIKIAHQLLRQLAKEGDVLVDATMGNGQDTLFLSQLVGESGCVYAFDIQIAALTRTRKLLQHHGAYNVELIHDSHIYFSLYFTSAKAFIYNLGYLPGGDKNITTEAENTLFSIQLALQLLETQGLIALVVYPGHKAGHYEANCIKHRLQNLSQQDYQVLHYQFINRSEKAPYAFFIRKRK
jgi:methylase protein